MPFHLSLTEETGHRELLLCLSRSVLVGEQSNTLAKEGKIGGSQLKEASRRNREVQRNKVQVCLEHTKKNPKFKTKQKATIRDKRVGQPLKEP
jgi:hypothetical protein